jgi:rubrerythrin
MNQNEYYECSICNHKQHMKFETCPVCEKAKQNLLAKARRMIDKNGKK